MIKMIRERAGLVNYTNHSGKRTCAIVLSQNGVGEQEIMGRLEVGVQAYKPRNAYTACTVSKAYA